MSTASQLAANPIPTGQPKDQVSRETRNEKPETAVPRDTRHETRDTELAPFLIQQRPSAYTPENQAVWQLLFARRMKHLRQVGSSAFLRGIQAIGLEPVLIPDLLLMNQRLEPITGWRAVAVSGFLEPTLFFQCLAERRFPTTVIVRPMAQLDYLPEPDIFHDVFGHVPMHADPVFADFLQRFGALAATARNQAEVRMLTRLFWFTVEFGLIKEDAAGSQGSSLETGNRKLETDVSGASAGPQGPPRETRNQKPETVSSSETRNLKLETDSSLPPASRLLPPDDVKVYGSGLISSHADCVNALGPDCERRPFNLDEVLTQEFEIDHLQPVLFVIDSHQQLFDAVEEVRERMSHGLLAEDGEGSSSGVRLCSHDHGRPSVMECQQELP
jgi:phenylalanine-4-hydroxylase